MTVKKIKTEFGPYTDTSKIGMQLYHKMAVLAYNDMDPPATFCQEIQSGINLTEMLVRKSEQTGLPLNKLLKTPLEVLFKTSVENLLEKLAGDSQGSYALIDRINLEARERRVTVKALLESSDIKFLKRLKREFPDALTQLKLKMGGGRIPVEELLKKLTEVTSITNAVVSQIKRDAVKAGIPPEEALKKHLKTIPITYALTNKENGEVLGVGSVIRSSDYAVGRAEQGADRDVEALIKKNPEAWCCTEYICVKKDLRFKGLGSRIMDGLFTEAEKLGFDYAALYVAEDRFGFYKRWMDLSVVKDGTKRRYNLSTLLDDPSFGRDDPNHKYADPLNTVVTTVDLDKETAGKLGKKQKEVTWKDIYSFMYDHDKQADNRRNKAENLNVKKGKEITPELLDGLEEIHPSIDKAIRVNAALAYKT